MYGRHRSETRWLWRRMCIIMGIINMTAGCVGVWGQLTVHRGQYLNDLRMAPRLGPSLFEYFLYVCPEPVLLKLAPRMDLICLSRACLGKWWCIMYDVFQKKTYDCVFSFEPATVEGQTWMMARLSSLSPRVSNASVQWTGVSPFENAISANAYATKKRKRRPFLERIIKMNLLKMIMIKVVGFYLI